MQNKSQKYGRVKNQKRFAPGKLKEVILSYLAFDVKEKKVSHNNVILRICCKFLITFKCGKNIPHIEEKHFFKV